MPALHPTVQGFRITLHAERSSRFQISLYEFESFHPILIERKIVSVSSDASLPDSMTAIKRSDVELGR